MKHTLAILLSIILSGPASAQHIAMSELSSETARHLSPVARVVEATFPRMPGVSLTSALRDVCGGDEGSDPHVIYCTSLNKIYVDAKLSEKKMSDAEMGYRLAHAYGHAVQVRHGIADIALATIRANRAEETALRGMVTRQVECIAGVLMRRAYGKGVAGPAAWAGAEPFTGSHWGASPVARGPKVAIGLAERNAWFEKGRDSDDFASCAVGVFPADLILKAESQR